MLLRAKREKAYKKRKEGTVMKSKTEDRTVVSNNKKAFHDYFVLETFEAGLELVGTEVKSVRQGKVNLKDSWCSIDGGELFVMGMHISPYRFGNRFNVDPRRVRRLLMHKKEIRRLKSEIQEQGRAKVELGLCKGKKLFDKRDTERKKAAQRDIERTLS